MPSKLIIIMQDLRSGTPL